MDSTAHEIESAHRKLLAERVPLDFDKLDHKIPINSDQLLRTEVPASYASLSFAENDYHLPVEIQGKYLRKGKNKFQIKGVTYGTFKPDEDGHLYPPRGQVERDFTFIKSAGFNTVRLYTAPPLWLMEVASKCSLYLIVGLTWEQHVVSFLNKSESMRIIESVRKQVIQCDNHSAILAFTLGNEIPSSIVRWHGAEKIEKFLRQLFTEVKSISPNTLVTYVNYPPTEYLDLCFLDFISFNVYLESPESLEKYLARLHNIAEDKPLVMAEIGLDSLRNGNDLQSETLAWQLETCRNAGLAGAIVFAWTDEWHRGGMDIEDWHFGLVDKYRNVKPALSAVSREFRKSITSSLEHWPRITIAICTYNGARTIKQTLDVLNQYQYPDFEVLVVNDGSTDDTATLVSQYPCSMVSTENHGLSSARNTAWQHARGDIVAYLDDDAFPDEEWLYRLAMEFADDEVGAVGGPNLLPDNSNDTAFCVSHSPGGPNHVLETDVVAEHVPGCNMAIRKSILHQLGGFDAQFRAAGDDVDMCWRIRDAGWTIRFCPTAVVFHHRRNTVAGYWKQQRGYGLAEAMLANKYPGRINSVGHLSWSGVIYGKGLKQTLRTSGKQIDYGVWGTGFYQSIYTQPAKSPFSILLVPEIFLVMIALIFTGILGVFWPPLYAAGVLGLILLSLIIIHSVADTQRTLDYYDFARSGYSKWKCRLLVFYLHLLQPVARLQGRFRGDLTPFWQHKFLQMTEKSALPDKFNTLAFTKNVGKRLCKWTVPKSDYLSFWSESYVLPEQLLEQISKHLSDCGFHVKSGTRTDRWDLQVIEGCYRKVRLLISTEEHGGEQQMFRIRLSSYTPKLTALVTLLLSLLIVNALVASAWPAAIALTAPALLALALVSSDSRSIIYDELVELAQNNGYIVSTTRRKLLKTITVEIPSKGISLDKVTKRTLTM